ncbi:type I phosphodiesterase/nucleotide pyrophosphatase [Candidatus Scalindua japonica]|uniref:Type I phosphodiesterase/nucleotide pyrophosphatase n=1 Tax=Candidatus Scalindua japonica TaxID=1284222 RepID=A0A286TUV3_9BACT|nr:alkaline phosphatase family protein [Candidatus Scalindua japonica]GAX59672.1 type I phosphodiesterase/nucleotide pyrophosphatase [Candidatus Scalindua japonica]
MRTLFIGMDGATFRILDELVKCTGDKQAVMPFLSMIYKKGVRSKLLSTPNPLTPPAWVSLMTGKNPGNHGVFDFIRAEERGDDVFFTLYDSRDNKAETIWSIASRQGKRVAALNFPFTAPPPKDYSGFMVPGFIPWRHLRRNTVPTDFYDRLKSLQGFNPKELAWDFDQEKNAVNVLSDTEREDWVRYHLPREKQWFRIAEHLLSEEPLDLLAVMFDGVDKLQHQAWMFLDPGLQSGIISEYHQRMRKLCMEYFMLLDGFIEALVNAAGPDVQVFMASDHGFTTTHEVVRINSYLHEKGYLDWKVMPDTKETVRREESMFANLDWKNTTAYCRTTSSNGINIRVARNPGDSGIKPKDYENFRDQLINDLQELRDLDTGERVISHIHKREDIFPGLQMKEAPDLLLVFRDFGFVSIKNKKPIIEQREEVAGTHHPDGVFFAYGQGIKQGKVIERRNITDVGATLLYSLGLDVPGDFEGQVPEPIFTEQHLLKKPVVIGAATNFSTNEDESESMSEDENEQLMTQLRMLGYME